MSKQYCVMICSSRCWFTNNYRVFLSTDNQLTWVTGLLNLIIMQRTNKLNRSTDIDTLRVETKLTSFVQMLWLCCATKDNLWFCCVLEPSLALKYDKKSLDRDESVSSMGYGSQMGLARSFCETTTTNDMSTRDYEINLGSYFKTTCFCNSFRHIFIYVLFLFDLLCSRKQCRVEILVRSAILGGKWFNYHS